MRRTRWEVYSAILKEAKNPVSATHLYYTLQSSYGLVKTRTNELEGKGMLEVTTKEKNPLHGRGARLLSKDPKKIVRTYYETTEKGKVFLQKIEDMINFWKEGYNL